MKNGLTATNFDLPRQVGTYKGKVRDVYYLDEGYMMMVVTDRISAFDRVLREGIPYKGQVLNQMASRFLDATEDIVPNWKIATPDPMVTFGRFCTPFRVEMVIRGYLTGHAWREYQTGKRLLCGVPLPGGMKENDKFPAPIITPTTKAMEGHDEDISKDEIIREGLVDEKEYLRLEAYTRELFNRGTQMAAEKGLILVDTKYEFGKSNGTIYLIDEIHTPDSSRYFYADGYDERQQNGEKQRQLSKEFVRQWLMDNGFQGKPGQIEPIMPPEFVSDVSKRYIELFQRITGDTFEKPEGQDVEKRVEHNIFTFLDIYFKR